MLSEKWKMGFQSARTENVYFGQYRCVELAIMAARECNRIIFAKKIAFFAHAFILFRFNTLNFRIKHKAFFSQRQHKTSESSKFIE